MPSRASKGRDFFANARRVVEQAIGEHMDGTPFEDPDAGKNPAALARVYQPEMEKLPRGRSWSGNERLQDV